MQRATPGPVCCGLLSIEDRQAIPAQEEFSDGVQIVRPWWFSEQPLSAWEVLANWFLTTNDFESEQASPAVAASTLLPEQFTESTPMFLSTFSNPGTCMGCSCRRSNAISCF